MIHSVLKEGIAISFSAYGTVGNWHHIQHQQQQQQKQQFIRTQIWYSNNKQNISIKDVEEY